MYIMASLSFKSVLLVINLVFISEIVCFPGHLLRNNLFSNGLHYVSKHLTSIQSQFSLQKLLIPETYTQNNIYARPNGGEQDVLQSLPTSVAYTEAMIEKIATSTESSNYNNDSKTQNSKIENKDIDEKWNSFFDAYFKNQTSKIENSLVTTDNNNKELPKISKHIFDDTNTETTNYVTDTTDTTLFDNETTTTDDLLRNGVPPELLSSLLG